MLLAEVRKTYMGMLTATPSKSATRAENALGVRLLQSVRPLDWCNQ
jgi:hypothetical protein